MNDQEHHHLNCQAHSCHHTANHQSDSIFIGLMGSPFQSDWLADTFVMIDSLLRHKKEVTVWTCGYSTLITHQLLKRPNDPIHPLELDQVYALQELVQGLFRTYSDQLQWYVCEYCMNERGASIQIPEVEIRLPFSFNSYLTAADQSIIIGEK